MKARLTVNGRTCLVEADADMPLLWLLRDLLQLTGTKFGCGAGLCGACTVHLDGKPVRACITTWPQAIGRRITTIEGLDPRGDHPVQQAWRDTRVPQCGYCQAGQMMTAAALLESTPEPSDEEVRQAMNGHLCRCGTYARVEQAVQLAVQISKKGGR
jgi:isoquinoline 1-oxidoreductase alpha subunit